MEYERIATIPIALEKDTLIERIGGAKSSTVSRRLEVSIHKALEEVHEHLDAQAICKIVPVNKQDGTLFVDGNYSFQSQRLASVLEPCGKAVVFVTTIGSTLDDVIQENMANRPHYGYILDTAASLAAETSAQFLHEHIEDTLTEDDEGVTKRYSPGYCDWPLAEQKQLFDMLPSDQIGVELSDTACMSPRKSVSGIIGICPADAAQKHGNACITCQNVTCTYRRT